MADNPQFAHLQFVSPDYVAEKAKGEGKTVVLDVREPSEFEEGHVKGATNVPSGLFKEQEKLDAVIEQHVKGASEVVVHCMLSKQRGPTAASTLLARIKELGLDASTDVKVMEGGIIAFMDKYDGDAAAAELPKGTWTKPDLH